MKKSEAGSGHREPWVRGTSSVGGGASVWKNAGMGRSRLALPEVSRAQRTGCEGTGPGRWVSGWSRVPLGGQGGQGSGVRAGGPSQRPVGRSWHMGAEPEVGAAGGQGWPGLSHVHRVIPRRESTPAALAKAEMPCARGVAQGDERLGLLWKVRGVGPWVCLTVKPAGVATGRGSHL